MKKIFRSLISKFYAAPPRFAGGLFLNILGYHILRILFFHISYAIRRKISLKDEKAKSILNDLLRDGVAVIPDFFSNDVFEKIKKEYAELDLKTLNEKTPYIRRSNFLEGRQTPVFEQYLAKNEFINSIISAALRKPILILPKIQAEEMYYDQEDIGKPTTDERSDLLHFDVSYPTYKFFLYLTDTDERNAAFTYVRGSQKMTFARIWMEYKMSIAYFTWDKKRQDAETPEVSKWFLERNNMSMTPITGRANTLIIANTGGLHRRGDFLTTIHRYAIIVSYRALDSLKFFKRSLGRS